MNEILKKTTLLTMVFSLVFGFTMSAGAVTTDYTPTLKIKKVKDNYTTLQLVSAGLKKKNVKIKVKVKNIDTDDEETRSFEAKLNKSGKIDLKIDNLVKDNQYSFKAEIKEDDDDDYSDYSDEVVVNADGAYNYNTEIDITDTNTNSVVMEFTATNLKKKKVKIKVRIENEDNDTIEVRVYSKTLSKNGKTEITIDNLAAGTDYNVEALVRQKNKKNGFSKSSGAEGFETED